MGKLYDGIDARMREFIAAQPMFFVATAPTEDTGHINISPKGLAGTFAVLTAHRVAYLDYTGSGAETIAHLRQNGRIAIMFCAFTGPPNIVRLHGRGRAVLPGDAGFGDLREHFGNDRTKGLRAIIDVDVTRISDSCGFSVPLMTFDAQRDLLDRWTDRKSDDELIAYRTAKNTTSVDGLPGYPVSGSP